MVVYSGPKQFYPVIPSKRAAPLDCTGFFASIDLSLAANIHTLALQCKSQWNRTSGRAMKFSSQNQLHFSLLLFSDSLIFNRLTDSHNVPCMHISQNDSLGRHRRQWLLRGPPPQLLSTDVRMWLQTLTLGPMHLLFHTLEQSQKDFLKLGQGSPPRKRGT